MKAVLFLLLGFSFSNGYSLRVGKQRNIKDEIVDNLYQYDTSNVEIKKFKTFSNRFFNAIKSNDTVFLIAHVIFPITNSSFTDMDSTLRKNKKIDRKYF